MVFTNNSFAVKWFDLYVDASDYQLGACVVQEGQPVAYFSCKLLKSEQKYTVTEKEMLSIVAALNKFQSMLLGSDIHVLKDHKTLTFDTLKMQRVLCCCNKVKEFSPTLHYIEGPRNIPADHLSGLHRLVTPAQTAEGKNLVEPAVVFDAEDDAYFLTQEFSGLHDDELVELIECYLHLPETLLS